MAHVSTFTFHYIYPIRFKKTNPNFFLIVDICGSIECPEDTETCQYSLILPDYYRIPETRQRCLSKDGKFAVFPDLIDSYKNSHHNKFIFLYSGTILFETYEPARP